MELDPRYARGLSPEDDYTHPLGPESNFNESMYFNFFDPERSLGGFVRIGNRANEGHAETTVTLFLPDGRVLFSFERPPIAGNEAMDAGGLRFDVIEPGRKLRTRYEGRLVELHEPREMADPRKAFGNNPKRQVRLDLAHEAVGPIYGSAGSDEEESRSAERQFARAHYEQHMRVTGRVRIDGEELEIEGFGLRDHSWGPRTWQAIEGYEWLTMNFGADLGAMISVIRRDGRARVGGVVVRGDEIDAVKDAVVEADYEENGLFHKAVRARIETRKGERLEISGTVRAFIPLRNRRAGMATHIGEGMTEWRLGDRVGYGLSEFLRQVG
jgi:hypothetical protein